MCMTCAKIPDEVARVTQKAVAAAESSAPPPPHSPPPHSPPPPSPPPHSPPPYSPPPHSPPPHSQPPHSSPEAERTGLPPLMATTDQEREELGKPLWLEIRDRVPRVQSDGSLKMKDGDAAVNLGAFHRDFPHLPFVQPAGSRDARPGA